MKKEIFTNLMNLTERVGGNYGENLALTFARTNVSIYVRAKVR